jgi:uncharacterized membrane protein YeaQ/YmgE (transglycosylase-associated protein family)
LTTAALGINIPEHEVKNGDGALNMDDNYARGSVRKRAARIARQRGWIGEGGGGVILPAVVGVLALLVVLWMAVTVSGFLFSLLPLAAVGLLTGWVASKLTGARLGVGWTLLAGILGSWLGGAILGLLHIGAGHLLNPINLIASVAGAAVLITFARVLARPALTGGERARLGRGF